jgi:hypothetical protein
MIVLIILNLKLLNQMSRTKLSRAPGLKINIGSAYQMNIRTETRGTQMKELSYKQRPKYIRVDEYVYVGGYEIASD